MNMSVGKIYFMKHLERGLMTRITRVSKESYFFRLK